MKRRSNYSPVIVFETTDPKRLYQLKDFIVHDPDLRGADNIFVYDPWDGLGRVAIGTQGFAVEPYRKTLGQTSPLQQRARLEDGVSFTSLRAVLKEIDQFIKRARTIFVIQNLAEHRESETGLQAALRAWAIDPAVVTKGSTVFLVTADVTRILDEYTRELVLTISVDPSSARERESTIGAVADELQLPLDANRLQQLVMATAGLNLHQLESILLESYFTQHNFQLEAIKRLKSELVKRSGVLEIKEPQSGFADIGGYQAVKDFIRKYVINVLQDAERARRFALPLPKGMLFFGPPGTGKSLFANALASEVGLPFINLVTENIYSKWLGESGQNMKNAIRLAEKMSPAIVFVDEIDRFGKRGQAVADSAGEETRRVFSQFLEWLGTPDREAIIVGTTNVPEHLDEAFTRTGRFDYKIPFLYPGDEARADIMAVHLGITGSGRKSPTPLDMPVPEVLEFLRSEMAPRTVHFSGAELEELVTRAKRLAFDRGAAAVGKSDLLQAASTFRINPAERRLVIENYLAQARRFTDDQTFLDAMASEVGIKI